MPDNVAPASRSPREVLVENERMKYSANYMNGIALAVFAIGGVAPFIGAATSGGQGPSLAIFAVAAVCWLASLILHWFVLRWLARLAA